MKVWQTVPMLAAWQECWREGIAPQLPTAGLRALARALEADDPRLLQGQTTQPVPVICCTAWPCEKACPVAFALWQDEADPDASTVGRVDQLFASACFACDRHLGACAACAAFLNWADSTPREEMFPQLLGEVRSELSRREGRVEPVTQEG